MSDNPFAESPTGQGGNPFYEGGGQDSYANDSYGGTMQDAYTNEPPPPPPPVASSDGKKGRKSGKSKAPPPEPSPFNEAASAQPSSFNGAGFAAGASGTASLSQREAALAQREAALKAKEAELAQILGDIKPPNWPSCKPFLYHDIEAEIPVDNQRPCRAGYYIWILTANAYFWNAVVILVLMITSVVGFLDFIFAGFIAVIGIYLSWKLWYRSLYSAMMTEKTTRYVSFFFHFLPHIGLTIWAIISLPDIGSMFVGIITMAKAWDESGFLGIISLLVLCAWSASCALSILLLIKVFAKFRYRGGVEKVQAAGQAAVFAANAVDNMESQPQRNASNVKQTNVFV